MPIIAKAPGRIALAGYFSILQKALGIGRINLYSLPVDLFVEIGISARNDRDINVALVDYGKSNIGTWDRYINFSNPPSFADEELYSPVFCGVETVFNYLESKEIKFSGINISVKRQGIIGEPFGTQCLAADHAVMAATIYSLIVHYNIQKDNIVEELLKEADKFFSNDKLVDMDNKIYVQSKVRKKKNTNSLIKNSVFFSTGLGSYRNVLIENLLEAFKIQKKVIDILEKGIILDKKFKGVIKSMSESEFKKFMQEYEKLLEELRNSLNINLGYKLDRELNSLRKFAYVIPLELNYSAHYMAIPKKNSDLNLIKKMIEKNNWEIKELKEGNPGIEIIVLKND
ncbi:MAG: hypothetical protein QXF76_00760 [Candidatus Anstonellales archaeon]